MIRTSIFTSRSSILSILALGAVLACTAVVSEDPIQCKSDAECTERGADFKETICDPNGLCIAKPPPPPPTPECTKNSQCNAAKNEVCSSIQQKCAVVTSDDCKVAYGDPLADGTVLYGLLSEIAPDDSNYFRQRQHESAAKLAFQEYFEKAGAKLPGERRAALIACSEHFPRRASGHLANIGVTAVIGPSSEERQKAVVETLLPARTVSWSPWINGNPSAVVPQAAGFAWLAGFKRSDVVAPLNGLLAEQEAKLKATAGGITSVRVAVVLQVPTPPAVPTPTPPFNAFAEYGDLMDQKLTFNGKSAVENERDATCGNCYKRFETNQAPVATVTQRAEAIIAFKPHFIIPFTDIDWGAQLLPKLEEKYALEPVETPRPIYLQAFLQIEDAGYKSLNVASAVTRQRVTGIRPVRDNSFEVFQNKFRDAFRPPSAPEKPGPDANPGGGRAFETTLLLLLATHSALLTNPNAMPEDVVAALKNVTDPAATKITLNELPIAVQRLNAKEHIKFSGLFTFFDFDAQTNSAPPTWTTWCMGDKGQYISGARIFKDGTFGAPVFCE